MDGTIADLYGVPNWLKMIKEENPEPFILAKPMCNMEKLRDVLIKLIVHHEWQIRIITWLPKDASQEYKNAVRAAKREWLRRHNFPCAYVHMVTYGRTKADCIRKKSAEAILIDDNTKVRNGWSLGRTIDPLINDIVFELNRLYREGEKNE